MVEWLVGKKEGRLVLLTRRKGWALRRVSGFDRKKRKMIRTTITSTKIRMCSLMEFQKTQEQTISTSSWKDGEKLLSLKSSRNIKAVTNRVLLNFQPCNKQKTVFQIQANTHCIKVESDSNRKTSSRSIGMRTVGFVRRMRSLTGLYSFIRENTAWFVWIRDLLVSITCKSCH